MRYGVVLTVGIGLLGGFVAHAHGDTGIQKVRHNFMESLGGHMGVIGEIMKRKMNEPEMIAAHAQAIAAVAPQILGAFPKGSGGGDSDAKDEIWKNWSDFEKKAKAFQDAAKDLAEASKSKDMKKVGPAVGALGKSCKGCHEKYKDD